MHCSANVGKDGDVALFFGLLAPARPRSPPIQPHADRRRRHGWGPHGVFNLRAGYANASSSRARRSPESTTRPCASVGAGKRRLQSRNAHLRFRRRLQDREHPLGLSAGIHPQCSRTGRAGMPTNLVILTADAFGGDAAGSPSHASQALYHFLSGYTARSQVPEKGLVGVEPEFSTCFGCAFLPRHPTVYGNLLRELIAVQMSSAGWSTPAGRLANTASAAACRSRSRASG